MCAQLVIKFVLDMCKVILDSFCMDNSLSFQPGEDSVDESVDSFSDIVISSEDEAEQLSSETNESASSEEIEEMISEDAEGDVENVAIGNSTFIWKNEAFYCNAQKAPKPKSSQHNNNRDLFLYRNCLNQTPLQFFFLMFPIVFWKNIVTYSNEYAVLKEAVEWKPISLFDLFVWLIIVMIYAVRKTPKMSDMWSRDLLFNLPCISKFGMTYKRWVQIRKYFHVSPVIVPENSRNDKYFKVRYMKDTLTINSQLNAPYCEKYSLDEMTIGYQGRTHLIKRTPSKKVAKAFQCVALTTKSGYVLDFEFDHEWIGEDKYEDMSKTSNRVMRVMNCLSRLIIYVTVYMDNRFTGPLLFYYLFTKLSVYALGTWRVNYGTPKLLRFPLSKKVAVIDANKETGLKLAYCEYKGIELYGTGLYDNAAFYMLTTGNYVFEKEIGGTKNVERYDFQHDYNAFMCGNDTADALLVGIATYIRSFKFWIRMFHFLFDVGCNQAFLLYQIAWVLLNPSKKTPINHHAFFVQLIHELSDYADELNPKETTVSNKKRRCEDVNKVPDRIQSPKSHFPTVGERYRCTLCHSNGIESRSTISCSICNVNLCLNKERNCFVEFHTKEKL